MALKLTLDYDPDCDCPCDDDCSWQVYSFSSKHTRAKPVNEYAKFERGQIVPATAELRKKFRQGLAYWLSYFEHSLCKWSLRGEGTGDRWDEVNFAGIIIYEGPASDLGAKTYEAREKEAREFIGLYTDWCNGNCYGYSIEDDDGGTVDSCWGFIGEAAVIEAIKETGYDITEVDGDALCLWRD